MSGNAEWKADKVWEVIGAFEVFEEAEALREKVLRARVSAIRGSKSPGYVVTEEEAQFSDVQDVKIRASEENYRVKVWRGAYRV